MTVQTNKAAYMGDEDDLTPAELERQAQRHKEIFAPREAAIANGDVIGFLEWLVNASYLWVDYKDEFAELYRLMQREARRDPHDLVTAVLDRGMTTIGYLILRLRFSIEAQIRAQDKPMNGARVAELCVDQPTTRLCGLLTSFAEIAQARAGIARQAELARAKKIQNDAIEQQLADVRNGPDSHRKKGRPRPSTNGHPPSSNGRGNGRAVKGKGQFAHEDRLRGTR